MKDYTKLDVLRGDTVKIKGTIITFKVTYVNEDFVFGDYGHKQHKRDIEVSQLPKERAKREIE